MKISMKNFEEAEKPIKRPAKRFSVLPGGVIKREPQKYGGAEAEDGRTPQSKLYFEKLERVKLDKKPLGLHAVIPPEINSEDLPESVSESSVVGKGEDKKLQNNKWTSERKKILPEFRSDRAKRQAEGLLEFNKEVSEISKIIRLRKR